MRFFTPERTAPLGKTALMIDSGTRLRIRDLVNFRANVGQSRARPQALRWRPATPHRPARSTRTARAAACARSHSPAVVQDFARRHAACAQAASRVTSGPPIFSRPWGRAGSIRQAMSFHGEPVEQASCLMRGMDQSRNLAPALESLPAPLATRVGQETGLPSREALSGYLSKLDLEWDFAAYLWQPVSRANDNDPDRADGALFRHPRHQRAEFRPPRLSRRHRRQTPKINNLAQLQMSRRLGQGARRDQPLRRHAAQSRARQFLGARPNSSSAANFAGALKGLFLHVELIQPRRAAAPRPPQRRANAQPRLSPTAQYDRLALLYVIASVRAGRWLIPAFHAALDADIPNGHDDPLNFDLKALPRASRRWSRNCSRPTKRRRQIASSADRQRRPDRPSLPSPPLPVQSAAAGCYDASDRCRAIAAGPTRARSP